jgi:hypothetical protein
MGGNGRWPLTTNRTVNLDSIEEQLLAFLGVLLFMVRHIARIVQRFLSWLQHYYLKPAISRRPSHPHLLSRLLAAEPI